MRKFIWVTGLVVVLICWPGWAKAQGLASDIGGLQSVLDQLYNLMLPLCSQLIGVGRAIGGFAAIWYIGARVWRHIARAEPVDLYPLFRPFVLGFCILIFPGVIALINGVMQPVVGATSGMVTGSDQAIATLLQQQQAAIQQTSAWQMYVGASGNGDEAKWYQYTHPDASTGSGTGWLQGIGNDVQFAMAKASYNFRNSVKQWLSEILQVLYEAAALCINTIRIFYLIVLAILGPLVFGLSIFDGFQHTLSVWLARYINVFMWLPVANIFGAILGKIQQEMLQVDISQIQATGDTFFSSTDAAYLIFLIIAIVGYCTVPSVANYIVYAGGGNALLARVTGLGASAAQGTVMTGGMVAASLGHEAERMAGSVASYGTNAGYFPDSKPADQPGGFNHDRVAGD